MNHSILTHRIRLLRACAILMAAVTALGLPAHTDAKTVTVRFDIGDFRLSENGSGKTFISTHAHTATYDTDPNTPALPFVNMKVLIPSDSICTSVSYRPAKRIISDNIDLAGVPLVVPTDALPESIPEVVPDFNNGFFPDSQVRLAGNSMPGGFSTVELLVSPFEYDSGSGRLWFADELEIELELSGSVAAVPMSSAMERMVRDLCVNGTEMERIKLHNRSLAINPPRQPKNTMDYLIVTNDSLAPSFERLITWKRMRGLNCELKTVESIHQEYFGLDIPLKIKKYIHKLYKDNGLKYVLLGGDDNVVPVRGCYGAADSWNEETLTIDIYEDTKIPADLYYACFGGNFEWNANSGGAFNQIYGEVNDSVDLTPSVFVTRLPVRTRDHADICVQRLLNYESNPKSVLANKAILMAGNKISKFIEIDSVSHSDVEVWGEIFYDRYIKDYWDGRRVRLYDTATDFPGGRDYPFSAKNLSNELQRGYPFVNIDTHGNGQSFKTELDNFSDVDVLLLKSGTYSILTTSACETNQFDNTLKPMYYLSDPCLSEVFIRNKRCNLIGYIGSSRYGWSNRDYTTLGPSDQMNAIFYKNLFNQNLISVPFGELIAKAKLAQSPSAQWDGYNRWLQYSVNPIGDPEMPVFREAPGSTHDIAVRYLSEDSTINISTKSKYTITVTRIDGDKPEVDRRNADKIDPAGTYIVCVSQRGMVPAIFPIVRGTLYLQNVSIFRNYNEAFDPSIITFEADRIVAGADVTPLAPKGEFTAAGGTIVLKAREIKMAAGARIEKGTQFKTIKK